MNEKSAPCIQSGLMPSMPVIWLVCSRWPPEDVVFLAPGQAPFGREGFSSTFRTAHQQMRICCISELEEVTVVGEVAYTRSRDALSVTPHADGKAAQFAGHRTTVYRKQQDGRWLLSRDVHTLSPVKK